MGERLFLLACTHGHCNIAEFLFSLLERNGVEVEQQQMNDCLRKAVTRGCLPVAKFLLSKEADVDSDCDTNHRPAHLPLRIAYDRDDAKMVRLLLEHRAKVPVDWQQWKSKALYTVKIEDTDGDEEFDDGEEGEEYNDDAIELQDPDQKGYVYTDYGFDEEEFEEEFEEEEEEEDFEYTMLAPRCSAADGLLGTCW